MISHFAIPIHRIAFPLQKIAFPIQKPAAPVRITGNKRCCLKVFAGGRRPIGGSYGLLVEHYDGKKYLLQPGKKNSVQAIFLR
jgi:hypothetical protein